MAGDEAVHGTKIVDSSGFSASRRIKWYNAKYGNISVKLFDKMHLIHTPQGKICIAMVVSGKANDSPYPRMIIKMLPGGSGDLLGDAAFRVIKNCNAVRESGRRPVIDKSNAVSNGHNARADMIRFCDEHPRTFYNILRIRNNVESVFASIKDRFGSIVRTISPHIWAVELLSMCICYNMTFE